MVGAGFLDSPLQAIWLVVLDVRHLGLVFQVAAKELP
jgi:hypothetical protein